jgi:predicted RND superfamily exporter protein
MILEITCMKYRIAITLSLTVFVLTLLSLGPSVLAQTNQVTGTVSMDYFNIQVTYPAVVAPGDSVTAHVQANAKSSFDLVSLMARIFYGDGMSVQELVNKTLSSNIHLYSGNSLKSDIQFNVPNNLPRTSLLVAFSESVRSTFYDYYDYQSSYYYNYSNPYPYYYYYGSYPYYMTSYYPAYSSKATDVGIASLAYVNATTPEQTKLLSENQQLRQQLDQSESQNQQIQQQLSQSQANVQGLKQDLQNAQSTISQQNSAAADMSQKLTTNQTLSLGLGALVVLFAALTVHFRRQRGKANNLKQATTVDSPKLSA